jgi:hypothetical protein
VTTGNTVASWQVYELLVLSAQLVKFPHGLKLMMPLSLGKETSPQTTANPNEQKVQIT